MSDEATPPSGGDNTPPPATPPAAMPPAGDPATPPVVTPPVVTPPVTPPVDQAKPGDPPAYKIPDAYKDKPWAAKIKSEEDLYKQIDTLDALKGKKYIAPGADEKPEEVDKFYQSLRPAEKTAYKFSEQANPEITGPIADMLFESGVSEYQASKLVPLYEKFEKQIMDNETSGEGFTAVMKQNFGDQYDGIVVQAQEAFKTKLTKEQGEIVNAMPNQYLGPLYQLVKSHNEEIAKLKEEYGVKENADAHLENGGAVVTGVDLDKAKTEARQKIRDLDKRPHTQAEKDKLQKEYEALYK